jgi:hypothetical protein
MCDTERFANAGVLTFDSEDVYGIGDFFDAKDGFGIMYMGGIFEEYPDEYTNTRIDDFADEIARPALGATVGADADVPADVTADVTADAEIYMRIGGEIYKKVDADNYKKVDAREGIQLLSAAELETDLDEAFRLTPPKKRKRDSPAEEWVDAWGMF